MNFCTFYREICPLSSVCIHRHFSLGWLVVCHSPLSPGRPTQRSCDSLTSVWLLWLTKQNSHLGSQAFLQEDASHSYLLHQDRLSGSPKKKPVLCNGDLQEVSFSQALPRKGCCISRPHGATCAPGKTGGKLGASFSGPSTRTITARPALFSWQPEFSIHTQIFQNCWVPCVPEMIQFLPVNFSIP